MESVSAAVHALRPASTPKLSWDGLKLPLNADRLWKELALAPDLAPDASGRGQLDRGRLNAGQFAAMNRQSQSVLEARLLKNVHQVNLHRSRRNVQILSDLLVPKTLADQPHNFLLARCQARGFLALQELRGLFGLLHPDLALGNFAQALEQRGHWQGLLQDASRADLQGSESVHLREVHHPQHAVNWSGGFETSEQAKRSGEARASVDQNHIGANALDGFQCISSPGCPAGKDQIVTVGQNSLQTFDDDGLWFTREYRNTTQ